MNYTVFIDPAPTSKESGATIVQNVLQYTHQGNGVFYVAGSTFEKWFLLVPGQVVSVYEDLDIR